ncbi:hypothetical protein NQ315_006852 [Exocentrus adspersus]|uniref:Uncharacterized protein n=1 Tax=Exocentrus adspersus TaxID=1586481 RepID=A0AAV8WEG8_9CUCU|nr:hypothetical protein NQ315_006852 [Exocentrus adspersus]
MFKKLVLLAAAVAICSGKPANNENPPQKKSLSADGDDLKTSETFHSGFNAAYPSLGYNGGPHGGGYGWKGDHKPYLFGSVYDIGYTGVPNAGYGFYLPGSPVVAPGPVFGGGGYGPTIIFLVLLTMSVVYASSSFKKGGGGGGGGKDYNPCPAGTSSWFSHIQEGRKGWRRRICSPATTSNIQPVSPVVSNLSDQLSSNLSDQLSSNNQFIRWWFSNVQFINHPQVMEAVEDSGVVVEEVMEEAAEADSVSAEVEGLGKGRRGREMVY